MKDRPKVQRYEIWAISKYVIPDWDESKEENGDWCKYEDDKALESYCDEQAKRIEELDNVEEKALSFACKQRIEINALKADKRELIEDIKQFLHDAYFPLANAVRNYSKVPGLLKVLDATNIKTSNFQQLLARMGERGD